MRGWVGILAAVLVVAGCNQPAHTLHQAAKQEVYSTATCPDVEVSHVPTEDVATRREDVYVAEGCGSRWRMTCESKRALVCPKRRSSKDCRRELQWSCENIQSEDDSTDEELRARVTHEDLNIVGS